MTWRGWLSRKWRGYDERHPIMSGERQGGRVLLFCLYRPGGSTHRRIKCVQASPRAGAWEACP